VQEAGTGANAEESLRRKQARPPGRPSHEMVLVAQTEAHRTMFAINPGRLELETAKYYGWHQSKSVVAIAGIGYQGVAGFDGRLFAADAVLVEVHGAQPHHAVHDVFSIGGFELQESLLVLVQAVILLDIIMSSRGEVAGSARRVVDRLTRAWGELLLPWQTCHSQVQLLLIS
jgi:hypothetical protein